jgi:hypothetical protein
MSPKWTDPVKRIFDGDPWGLTGAGMQAPGLSRVTPLLLPPITSFPDNPLAGSGTFSLAPETGVWEDDLLASGVRSFDVKAFDASAPSVTYALSSGAISWPESYHDLGYFADPNVSPALPFAPATQAQTLPACLYGFGHEGRMPPAPNDNRFNPKWPGFNVGDANASLRLQRTFDTWSSAYTNVKDQLNGPGGVAVPGSPPVYPSYPPPYPAPLRGIQIHLRVADPNGTRVKSLTIKQDFSDRL